jgi:putative endonuclease
MPRLPYSTPELPLPRGRSRYRSVGWTNTVFIEVKTKGQALFGAPQAMVDARKQKKIVHVAMVYVQQHQLQDVNIRFDVVAITLLPGLPPEVTHVPGAFTPSSHFLY